MSSFTIRNFTQEDMPLLGDFYQAVAKDKKVVFWWVGREENWDNIFCAYDNGQMVAKGQVEVINSISEGQPEDSRHTIYLNLKTLPNRETDLELLNGVYEKLYTRALELTDTLSRTYQTNLCVGNFGTELNNNRFFTDEMGYQPLKTLYTMNRDINDTIIPTKLPNPELQWDFLKMDTEDEEKQYLEAESEIWPDAALGQDRLREYKNNESWIAIPVRSDNVIIASTMAWKEDEIGVIEDVFVKNEWRKQGIAKFLLTTALTYLKDNGLKEAKLMVDTDNENALNLYKSVGFYVTEEEKRFYTVLVDNRSSLRSLM
jgi:ribosomal protein S18 acetylase RimI-like enzyme